MKIVHSYITEVIQTAPKNKVPMFKDPVFMAELRRSFINDHNKKIKAKQA